MMDEMGGVEEVYADLASVNDFIAQAVVNALILTYHKGYKRGHADALIADLKKDLG